MIAATNLVVAPGWHFPQVFSLFAPETGDAGSAAFLISWAPWQSEHAGRAVAELQFSAVEAFFITLHDQRRELVFLGQVLFLMAGAAGFLPR